MNVFYKDLSIVKKFLSDRFLWHDNSDEENCSRSRNSFIKIAWWSMLFNGGFLSKTSY